MQNYYILPIIREYRKLDPKSPRAAYLARKIAANIGDYASLRLILGIDPPEFARFYPDMEPQTPGTLDTISDFLDKYHKDFPGHHTESIPYNIEIDLWETEPQSERKPGIQEKLNHDTKKEGMEDLQQSLKPDDWEANPPSRSALEIFSALLKKQDYEAALCFIEEQNLNNPQKSIYFAHQMRFLKKLIAIKKHKKQQKGF